MGFKSKQESVGLGALLNENDGLDVLYTHNPTDKGPNKTVLTLKYILDASDRELDLISALGPDTGPGLSRVLEDRVAALSAASESEEETTANSTGRLGPPQVVPIQQSGNIVQSAGFILESHGNFSSFRANTCVYSGKWMYEVVSACHNRTYSGPCKRARPCTASRGLH